MKTISETYYKVTQPDGGGMSGICVARFTSEAEATKYSKSLNESWPSYVREERICFTAFDTVEELIEAKSNKDALRNKIAELQKQLESY